MQNVLLIILLLLALALIIVVLMQRSEGGGLGVGGGGGGAGGNGLMSGRGAATALSKVTWIIAAGFLSLCIALTIIAARESGNSSVLDRLGTDVEEVEIDPTLPAGLQGDLLPPTSGGLELPPAAE
ncbi:preprotein translocase subunit SecG [Monaibacterium marinum]|uniref:Protein-export membrane protein SecG n=1 Tax=Pontivivens marinum TaxID=1690039 RepID=A0A2C9CVV6_9RHOB|nr:preprotein translocase subunit SecG [Monaibacterium marinum]SOH94529.1 preprotein translocase subunit SecG [Monaibacterium marinum]